MKLKTVLASAAALVATSACEQNYSKYSEYGTALDTSTPHEYGIELLDPDGNTLWESRGKFNGLYYRSLGERFSESGIVPDTLLKKDNRYYLWGQQIGYSCGAPGGSAHVSQNGNGWEVWKRPAGGSDTTIEKAHTVHDGESVAYRFCSGLNPISG